MDRPRAYCSNRHFEWTMALILFGIGIWLIIWPAAMSQSAFRYIYNVLGPDNLRLCYLMIGLGRILALYANGRWETWGPRVRAIGSICGAIIWLQMAAALLALAIKNGVEPSVGILFYTGIALAELKSTKRARADANGLR